jgi:hypothetical protein
MVLWLERKVRAGSPPVEFIQNLAGARGRMPPVEFNHSVATANENLAVFTGCRIFPRRIPCVSPR